MTSKLYNNTREYKVWVGILNNLTYEEPETKGKPKACTRIYTVDSMQHRKASVGRGYRQKWLNKGLTIRQEEIKNGKDNSGNEGENGTR